MKKLKMGTPSMGVAIGISLAGAAVLIMLIGFWKAVLLMLLFGIGYFIGTVENKQEFIRKIANKIIPAKEAKVIDIKSEITRDLEDQITAQGFPFSTETAGGTEAPEELTEKEPEPNEDGE